MKVSIVTHTDGKGLWSTVARQVRVVDLEIVYRNEERSHGELHASFLSDDWDVRKDGLIYTDKTWLSDLRLSLQRMGLSVKAVKEVDFSEQGMQGANFVSMDVGPTFLREWNVIS